MIHSNFYSIVKEKIQTCFSTSARLLSPTYMVTLRLFASTISVVAQHQKCYQAVRFFPLLSIPLKLWNFGKKLENQDKVEIVGLLLFIAADYKANGLDFHIFSTRIRLYPASYLLKIKGIKITKIAIIIMGLACVLIYHQLLLQIVKKISHNLFFQKPLASKEISVEVAAEKQKNADLLLAPIKSNLAEKDKEIASLISTLKDIVEPIKSNLAEKDKEIASLISTLKDIVEPIKSDLAEKDKEIATLKENLKKITDDIEDLVSDPVSLEIMKSPVSLPCGHTFDKTTVLKCNNKCPLDRKVFASYGNNFIVSKIIDTLNILKKLG